MPLSERYDRLSLAQEDALTAQLHTRLERSYRALTQAIEDGWADIAANKSLIAQQQRLLLADQLGDLLYVIKPGDRAAHQRLLTNALMTADDLGMEFHDEVFLTLNPDPLVREALESTTGVPIEALKAQADDTVSLLYLNGEAANRAVQQIISDGLIQNWGPKKTAAALQTHLGIVKRDAETIARTEIMNAFCGATKARAIQQGNYVQWVPIRDARTCRYCVGRSMLVYKAHEIQMPLHPRDRCHMVPIAPEWLEDYGVIDIDDRNFMAQYRHEGFKELAKNGKKPHYGAGPFDQGEGPKAVWTPKRFE